MRKKTKELFFLYLVKTVDREEKIGYNKCKYGKGAEDPPPAAPFWCFSEA